MRDRGSSKIPPSFLLLLTILGSTLGLLPSPAFASHVCGDTIMVSTTLSDDIGWCLGDGLIIGANNILLDCVGHWLTGDGDAGIILDGRTGVTVKNCNVTGFGYGFLLGSSSSNTLSGNRAEQNRDGIYLESSDRNKIVGNIAHNNGGEGIFFFSSSGNTLSGNFVNDNIGYGIRIFYSSKNTISGNEVKGNERSGFFLVFSERNSLRGNTANENNGDGYELSGCSYNLLYKNTGNQNTEYGVHLLESPGNTIQDNTLRNNGLGHYLDETGLKVLIGFFHHLHPI